MAGGGLLEPDVASPSDLFSFSANRNIMRLDDARVEALRRTISSPHGMRATVDEQLDRWHEKDPESEAGVRPVPLPRLGIGLPMSNIFASYVLIIFCLSYVATELTSMLAVTLGDHYGSFL